MSLIDILINLLVFSGIVFPSQANPTIRPRDVPDFVFPGDAPYGVPTRDLSSVLTCPDGNPTSADSKPVLLVHGTTSTGNESWGFGYVPALKAQGFTPCYIDLPNRAMGDMQISSSYIAYNVHYVSSLAGSSPIAVMGHSQGNPDIQWALHFWPSTKSVTSMYVGLSPDLSGVGLQGLTDFCNLDNGIIELCQPSLWQQANGSNYYKALNSKGHVAQVTTTLIWSELDEIVIPAGPNADLPSAINIPVQDLCPGRIADHLSMLIDAAGFALALDALNNIGTASLDRVRAQQSGFGVCGQIAAKGMDPTLPLVVNSVRNSVVQGVIETLPKVPAEPPVLSYALA